MIPVFGKLFEKKKDADKSVASDADTKKCQKEFQAAFNEVNDNLTRVIARFAELEKSTDTNTMSISYISQSIPTLALMMQTLSARLEKLENYISVVNIKFKKSDLS